MHKAFSLSLRILLSMSLRGGVSLALAALSLATGGFSGAAYAAPLPGPADVGRVRPDEQQPAIPHSEDGQIVIPSVTPTTPMPAGAKDIHFTLKEVRIDGATALTREQLHDIYAAYLGKDTTLDVAYVFARAITERYRNAGYFLSLAYVPQQHIRNGIITIKVVEGYVGSVEVPPEVRSHYVLRHFIADLVVQKPLTSKALESFLLRLNDLPGYSFRAVLSEGDADGAVRLTLVPAAKKNRGQVSFDNFGSRFLGPNEASASYSMSLLPLQQTTVSGLTTLPVKPLHYATLDHAIVIAPNLTFDIDGNITKAHPGYTLEKYDINSDSTYLGASLAYQLIRQRDENLALKLTLDGRDVDSDLLDAPFTRDHIRALRANANFDVSDGWQGTNTANATLSRGLRIFDASSPDDMDVSRAGAGPEFTKAELALSRLQGITDKWSLLASASGQLSSGVLYSSEQFGYGGQAFGRAYDASEITGDKGVAASLELRYDGWHMEGAGSGKTVNFEPYSFYDIGTVWNDAIGQPERESGSSVGLGIRANASTVTSADLGLAWPLIRQIATPIYGGAKQGPRMLLQLTQGF